MNPLLPLLMMLVSWSIDQTDPAVQWNVVAAFSAIHAILIVGVIAIGAKIYLNPNQSIVSVPLVQGGKEMEQITFSQYDMRKLRELGFTKILMPVLITLFIFNKWGVLLPLLFQSLNNPMQFYGSELFQIDLMGQPAKDAMARP